MLAPAPPADSPERYAADTVAMIIGDDSGSRLYWALVDPGLAESADMSFHDYEGAGSYFTSFSCEPQNTADNLALIQEILREVQREGVSEEELAVAKSKILSRVVRGSERPMGRMQAVGMGWTYLKSYRSVHEELANFDAVSLKDVRNVLDRYPFDQMTVLALGPLANLEG
jgi:predicted Zn-dependent peptidase